MNQLYIPAKIKVGYQNREGTYTGKLAYVICIDHTGKIRKERSWEGWRNKEIEAHEFENKPTEGFVLNKRAGGDYSHWGRRQISSRIYDPRGFEFEISMENLLFILQECNSSKGKGLEGEFVYSWDGKDLILLPAHCEEYKENQKFTELQKLKPIKAKSLVKGLTYSTKSLEKLIYIGRFDYYNDRGYKSMQGKDRFIFCRPDSLEFVVKKDIKNVVVQEDALPIENYADLVDKFIKSTHGSPIKEIYVRKLTKKELKRVRPHECWNKVIASYTKEGDIVQITVDQYNKRYTIANKLTLNNKELTLQDPPFAVRRNHAYSYSGGFYMDPRSGTKEVIEALGITIDEELGVTVKMESGSEYLVGHYHQLV